jgi:putative two-component system response regulator
MSPQQGSAETPGTVLIVDDDPLSLRLLTDAVEALGNMRVRAFERGAELMEALLAEGADLIITDIQMPEMDGFAVIEACQAAGYIPPIPIMVVTASTEREVRRRALQAGAADVISKPLDAEEIRARTCNLVSLVHAQRALVDRSAWLAEEVRRATAAVATRERETIIRLSRAAEHRDWETGQHILRIAEYVRLMMAHLALPAAVQEEIYLAAPLHDVGKIGIPDYILRKPDRLDPEEFTLMQRHTVIGYEILNGSQSHLLQVGAEIALSHHERFDGRGYPNALAGETIPLSGRLVAVADVFDALISRRPYKSAWTHADARTTIARGSGKEFDPDCVSAFLAVWDEITAIAQKLSDDAVASTVASPPVPAR